MNQEVKFKYFSKQYLLSRPELLVLVSFFIFTFIISLAVGTQFTLPNSNSTKFIGLHYIFPVLLVLFWSLMILFGNTILNRKNSKSDYLKNISTRMYLLVIFTVATWIHFHLKMWVPLINPFLYDNFYQSVDKFLNPLLHIIIAVRNTFAQLIHNYIHLEIDPLYLHIFILMFFISFSAHSLFDSKHFRTVFLSILLVQSLGAISYIVAPALGPFIYETGASKLATLSQQHMLDVYNNITLYKSNWLNIHMSEYFVAGLGAMPSLHIAAAWVFTYYAYRYLKPLFWVYLLMLFWIFIEAIASKWHYLIDLPFGIILAIFCIWLANRLSRQIASC